MIRRIISLVVFLGMSCSAWSDAVEVRFEPESIHIRDATVLAPEVLDEVLARFRNRPLGFADLQRLRLSLTELYSEAGFVNSSVVIPDQPLGAELTLQAVEGRLDQVVVVGDTAFRSKPLERGIAQRVSAPLNISQLQEVLEWVQRDALIERVDAELLPGQLPGSAILQLDVEDAPRYRVGIAIDNHRSPSLGSHGGQLFFTAGNLLGMGDTLLLAAGLSDGTDQQVVRYETATGFRGLRIAGYYDRNDSQIIEQRFESFDIISVADTTGVALTLPVVDDARRHLALALALENRNSESELLGIPYSFSPGALDGKSETATAELSAQFEYRTDAFAAVARASYRRGFHALGANEAKRRKGALDGLNPTGADGRFGRWLFQASLAVNLADWIEPLAEEAQLRLRSSWQIAEDPLMSLEKVAMGGARTVRGYRENTFVRDNGGLLSLEASLPVPGYRSGAHWRNLLIVPFLDVAWSWDERNTNPGAQDTSKRRRFASAGVGLVWRPLRGMNAAVYWGEPIDDNFESGGQERVGAEYDLQDDGIHASISYVWEF